MNRSRVASLCLVVALGFAPLSAEAQGQGGSSANLSARVAALEAAVAALQTNISKLNGNITAADLEGTYNVYWVATAIDSGPNTITSYVATATLTLGAGGTVGGQALSAVGTQLTEGTPAQNWVASNVSGTIDDGPITWAYSNGTVTLGDLQLTLVAGGQMMVAVQGGPPGNNQAIAVLTRQP